MDKGQTVSLPLSDSGTMFCLIGFGRPSQIPLPRYSMKSGALGLAWNPGSAI